MPPVAYLIGGTAIAAHLRHRLSRDLDFCFEAPVDLDAVVGELGRWRRCGSPAAASWASTSS